MSKPEQLPGTVVLGPVRSRSAPANVSFLEAWRAAHGPEALRRSNASAVRAPRRAYAGAAWGRTMSDWVALSTSADAELYLGLRALRNRSRDLA
ncbi:MAG TPA: hypothetical protein VFM48_07570, partial [Aquabacterium sp.]|nr:hypothetical protein [Aquabacterium sp.]